MYKYQQAIRCAGHWIRQHVIYTTAPRWQYRLGMPNVSYLRYKSTTTPGALSAEIPSAAKNPNEARLLIGFTCKVCNHRQHKTMSKNAYQKGVVLIQCDGCKNRHLIADNLGWFRDRNVNIEDLMREKGEQVRQLKDQDLLDDIEANQIKQALEDYQK
ncbi:hypothetical protein IWW36_002490 [Coemansia brasiliensis]|uniref:DNL-type domain-containing protein n=1 Tax=Coemansia brasiliensis TaxID=2650707 RepID=A0A9W8I9I6_9FUNG|nr:hypothetical protein IWW36_002490 [Coemansia brasiliensis]